MTHAQRISGFTLVELLIVIGILGLLAATFLPDLLGAKDQASEVATIGNMQRLAQGCEAFSRAKGCYPPDDLQDPEGKLQWKTDNGTNTGIESLVAFLSQSQGTGADLSDMGARLTNTDGDDHGAVLPLLGRKERLEVTDEWGTPFAYFSKTSQNLGFDKPQWIVLPGDQRRMQAKARLNKDGVPLGGRKFQLLSAGKDQAFGTEDDLSFPDQ